jgi:Fe-S cluster biogenesis protein NfuA
MGDKERNTWIQRINHVLDEVRPHLAEDGGNIEVLDVTDELDVKIKWVGSCENCSMSAMTLKAGVEQTIRQKFPEISGIVPVNGLKPKST